MQEFEPESFRQSTLFLLKRLHDDKALKEKVLNLLASDEDGSTKKSQLFINFGD
jgi:hypothetical protein